MNHHLRLLSSLFILSVIHLSFVNGQLDGILGLLATKAASLWQSKSVEFLGNECQYTTKPVFRKFELQFEGKFWCPGLAPYSGSSLRKSSPGALFHAQKEFVKKAVKDNHFTPEEASKWLEQ